MRRIEGELTIRRPIEEVFDFVADERNEPLFNPDMLDAELITPEPIGVGSRFAATTRSRGRPIEMEITVTDLARPTRLASRTVTSSMTITGRLAFEAAPVGTQMRWTWDLEPQGFLRLFGPLIERIGRRQEERIWQGLKELLEARPAPRGSDDADSG